MLILNFWHRQVTMQLNKQEQSTPYRARTFWTACSQLRILAVSKLRETRAESSCILKSQSDGVYALIPCYLILQSVIINPVLGDAAPGAAKRDSPDCIVAMS